MKLENFFGSLKSYLKDSFLELKKVNWLSRSQTTDLTIEVIIFAIVFVIIYGVFDAIFVKLIFMLR